MHVAHDFSAGTLRQVIQNSRAEFYISKTKQLAENNIYDNKSSESTNFLAAQLYINVMNVTKKNTKVQYLLKIFVEERKSFLGNVSLKEWRIELKNKRIVSECISQYDRSNY